MSRKAINDLVKTKIAAAKTNIQAAAATSIDEALATADQYRLYFQGANEFLVAAGVAATDTRAVAAATAIIDAEVQLIEAFSDGAEAEEAE